MELSMKQKLLQEALEDSMTKSEVLAIAKKLAEHVKKIEDKTANDVKEINKVLTGIVNELKDTTTNDLDTLKGETKELVAKELQKILGEHTNKMSEIDRRISEVKNGKDADEEKILETLLGKITIPEYNKVLTDLETKIPIMGEAVRDSLELLEGEDRLDISAIKGLRKILNKIKQQSVPVLGGGNHTQFFVDSETPSGTVDGVNKDFTVNNIPNPATSLIVYKDGQRMSLATDYTFSNQTISFIEAPLVDSILLVDYRL